MNPNVVLHFYEMTKLSFMLIQHFSRPEIINITYFHMYLKRVRVFNVNLMSEGTYVLLINIVHSRSKYEETAL